ncbi:MAG: hypothetical protein VX755_12340 [Pseudomonadota bacterium]|nr:hypothetical protein [Pseudomonadota bacterium]MED5538683.1 hypothetical protein [Pseudomonadota bacterium]
MTDKAKTDDVREAVARIIDPMLRSYGNNALMTNDERMTYGNRAVDRIMAYVSSAPILKGVGKINGDGWKDTTAKGEVVYVWNAEMPAPYGRGQFPRVGNEGWSASTKQYDFTAASAEDVEAILALLRPAAPDGGGEHCPHCDRMLVMGCGCNFTAAIPASEGGEG